MRSKWLVRPYRPQDEEQANALWKLPVYRPQDQAEVDAMFVSARRAQEAGDRWVAIPPRAPDDGPQKFAAFWVAQLQAADGPGPIIGAVAVNPVSEERTLPPDVPQAREWQRRDDVAVLDRLRVVDDAQRRGVGTRLVETVADWCRSHGFRSLILTTTSAQIPALSLYRKVGFREAFHSFVGKYELVWFEMDLNK